jgi:hypothetical protein
MFVPRKGRAARFDSQRNLLMPTLEGLIKP